MRLDRRMLIGWSSILLIVVVGGYVLLRHSAIRPAQGYNAFTPQWQQCYDSCVVASWSQWCLQPRGTNCNRIDDRVYNQVKESCRNYCNAKRD
jgi:hypothetical protein